MAEERIVKKLFNNTPEGKKACWKARKEMVTQR
jgi:hypothetical protein